LPAALFFRTLHQVGIRNHVSLAQNPNPLEWLVEVLAGFVERTVPGRIGKAIKWTLYGLFQLGWAAVVILKIASDFK
jgi:hypothetical protein